MKKPLKPTVLIVDDEAGVRIALVTALQEYHNVLEAGDATQALAILAAQPVAVVLMDIVMPGMDGIALLQKIKAAWPATEVIMVTAVTLEETARVCLQKGAFNYLTKPWNLLQLSQMVNNAAETWELSKLVRELAVPTDDWAGKEFGLTVQELRDLAAYFSPKKENAGFWKEVRRFEIHLIKQALEKTGGNKTKAAKLLRLSRNTFHYKLKYYKISAPE